MWLCAQGLLAIEYKLTPVRTIQNLEKAEVKFALDAIQTVHKA